MEVTTHGKKITVKCEPPQEKNMKAWQRIQREVRQKPEKWQAGQWVGLLQGNVVAASFDWKEVVAAVEKLAGDRHQAMLFRVGDNYGEMERML
jgi:hypothetical protein